MRRFLICFNIVFMILFFSCCSKVPAEQVNGEKRSPLTVEKNLVSANNQFGIKLFRELVKEENSQNVFISPLSISLALTMALNGADGKTRTAMQQTMEFANLSLEQINRGAKSLLEYLINLDPQVQFQIANSIWYRSGFKVEKDFLKINSNFFNARISGLDFKNRESVDIINSWVKENTNNKISKIVSSVNPLDVMFLINAIYFKGEWSEQFKAGNTRDADFTLPDKSKKKCRMMSQTSNFYCFENDFLQMIKLPYGKDQFAMTVLLPGPAVNLDSLILLIDQSQWNLWTKQLIKQKGTIGLPKFKLEYEKSLKDVLSSLGMEIAFTDKADFSKINNKEDLLISEVKHKSFIDVNEEGTEAAAATSVRMMLASARPQFYMMVDRPFIFTIEDNSKGTILFLGKIVDPTGE